MGHEDPEEGQMYSSTLPSTSMLDGGGFQRHARAALPSRKTRYLLYRRLGGTQGRSRRVRKISPPTVIRYADRPVRSQSVAIELHCMLLYEHLMFPKPFRDQLNRVSCPLSAAHRVSDSKVFGGIPSSLTLMVS